ncbi:UDP-2,3-diacylglucosamine diphosphatase [Flavitalea antarctica]
MKVKKRKVDVIVISDVHLGTYGCRAKELLHYLKSINPGIIVLNGDIIDIWQFSKRYWPKSHMKVVKHLMNWITKGKKTYYITGNHDEMLRKFEGLKMGSFSIVNKLVLELEDNKRAWIFHGDVFDVTMQHSKWLAKLGAIGYDTLILINSVVNFISERVFRKGKISLSKRIKNSVKSAVKFINQFEQTSADIGISQQYDYVICGHIHQPGIREMTNANGSILYLNSGDWIENLTALEYHKGEWSIYKFAERGLLDMVLNNEEEETELSNTQLFSNLLTEFRMIKK